MSSPSKNALEFCAQFANKRSVIVPMLLGYVVGSVGIYTFLYKVAPVNSNEFAGKSLTTETEIIELFPTGQTADQAKAA